MSKIRDLQNAVYFDGGLSDGVRQGVVSALSDSGIFVVLPGLVDVHVHLREPGFCYKEDIASGTNAALRGGFCTVCSMPNLNPVPDCMENLTPQLEAIKQKAKVQVLPYGAITVGQRGERLADMSAMAPFVVAFSDDGRGVQDAGLMTEAMLEAKRLGKIITAHCEDNSLIGGYINDCEFARKNNIKILPGEAEWRQLGRDMELVAKTGVSYHACHLSKKESVEIIREAKKSGLDVTCETAPHYLWLTDDEITDDGRYKMNPPIGSAEDRDALIRGVCDGTVDMIATDHAPHSKEEKNKGLAGSAFGVVGLETAFAVCYTALVKTGIIDLKRLAELMHYAPKERFKIAVEDETYSVFEVGSGYTVEGEKFVSCGKYTPFEGKTVFGKCIKTVIGGRALWTDKAIIK